MDKKLVKALNDQMNNEFYNANLYLSMAACMAHINLPGCSHWLKVQAKEEIGHGMKIYDFLNDRSEKATVQAIPQPPVDFSSPLQAFEAAAKHEKMVTGRFNNLVELARSVQDKATEVFLQWFITEQVEEEKNPTEIVAVLKMLKPDSGQIIMLDRELAKRE